LHRLAHSGNLVDTAQLLMLDIQHEEIQHNDV
jgi:hypothetical protein